MRHRIFELHHGVSLLGLKPQDLVVLYFSYVLGLQVFGALFSGRSRVLFAALFILLTFKMWQRLRDKLPDKFFAHLMRWLSEAEVYAPTPDVHAVPLIVDPERVLPTGLQQQARRLEQPSAS